MYIKQINELYFSHVFIFFFWALPTTLHNTFKSCTLHYLFGAWVGHDQGDLVFLLTCLLLVRRRLFGPGMVKTMFIIIQVIAKMCSINKTRLDPMYKVKLHLIPRQSPSLGINHCVQRVSLSVLHTTSSVL